MRHIFLFKDYNRMAGSQLINKNNCLCVDLSEPSFINRKESDISSVSPRNNIDKALIEKKYLDLIASLGKKQNSMYWWASSLSEKNPLISKLFTRIYFLLSLKAVLNDNQHENIAIYCPDDVLAKQIKNNLGISPFSSWINSWFCSCIAKIKGVLKQIFKAFSEYLKILEVRKTFKDKKIDNKQYTVVRTWMDHRNYKSGTFDDSYFKKLIPYLHQNDKDTLIFAGILKNQKNILQRIKKDNDNFILPVNFFLKGADILSCIFATYFRRPRIKGRVSLEGEDITHLIGDELSKDICTTSFFSSLTQFYCCKRLAQAIPIERFIYTFENYAWEKMSILGLKEVDPNIKTVGFQHAFISKNSFKYFPGNGEENIMPLPLKIVNLGRRTKEIMQSFGNFPKGIFSPGCALRQEYLFNLDTLPQNSSKDIFVPLTITVEDTVKVFRFIFSAGLGDYPGKVYFRFHPATDKEKVFDGLGFKLPSNFIISDNPPISEEFKRCRVVLYTWTTVCLEALKMGRPVIYLDVNYPLEVDPLFECNHLKSSCREPKELKDEINRLNNMDEEAFKTELDKVKDYINEYFIPVTDYGMNIFLN